MILTGVLAEDVGLIHGDSIVFVRHLITLFVAALGTFALSYVLYALVNRIIPLRVRSDQELRGLDYSQHGERLE